MAGTNEHTGDPIQADIDRADQLNRQAWELRRTDVNKAFSLAQEAHALSTTHSYSKGIAESLRTLGYCYWQFSDYPSALARSTEAQKLFRELGDKKGEADTVSSLGAVYAFMGDNEKRLKYNLDSLELRKAAGDNEGELITMNNIGDAYMKLGDYEKALQYFFECLHSPAATDHNNAIVLLNIGEVYYLKKDHDKSYEYLMKSIEVSEKHQYKRFVAAAYMTLGMLFTDAGNIPVALSWLDKAGRIAVQDGNNEDLYQVYEALSRAYEADNNPSLALYYYKLFHEIKEKVLNEDVAGKLNNMQLHFQVQSTQKEIEIERLRNTELKKAYEEIQAQRNEILEKNNQITDSIVYAKRIQEAILPSGSEVSRLLEHHFILYKPKDIVSGDFYWVEEKNGKITVAAVDCTGHGVPGAFMSIIGYNLLNYIVKEQGITRPRDILDHLNTGVSSVLKQSGENSKVRDGMDIALISLDPRSQTLHFAGANNPLYHVRDGKLEIYKANKTPIGSTPHSTHTSFTDHELKLIPGDMLYIFSDGYADQFGGEQGKKFKYRQLQELLVEIHDKPVAEQRSMLESALLRWQGDHEQVDDILVIGIRV